jgi:hypothetical protein
LFQIATFKLVPFFSIIYISSVPFFIIHNCSAYCSLINLNPPATSHVLKKLQHSFLCQQGIMHEKHFGICNYYTTIF